MLVIQYLVCSFVLLTFPKGEKKEMPACYMLANLLETFFVGEGRVGNKLTTGLFWGGSPCCLDEVTGTGMGLR